jgi:hypothetical protein
LDAAEIRAVIDEDLWWLLPLAFVTLLVTLLEAYLGRDDDDRG